jgi:hypothetical protein
MKPSDEEVAMINPAKPGIGSAVSLLYAGDGT